MPTPHSKQDAINQLLHNLCLLLCMNEVEQRNQHADPLATLCARRYTPMVAHWRITALHAHEDRSDTTAQVWHPLSAPSV